MIFHHVPEDPENEDNQTKLKKSIEENYNAIKDPKFEFYFVDENPDFEPTEKHICKGKSLNCKRDEIVTKSIIDSIDTQTKNMNAKKLNSTVILILDENYVVNQKAIMK